MGLIISLKRPKFYSQSSIKVIFYCQPSKMQVNVNRQNFEGIANLTISADRFQGLLAPEESLN